MAVLVCKRLPGLLECYEARPDALTLSLTLPLHATGPVDMARTPYPVPRNCPTPTPTPSDPKKRRGPSSRYDPGRTPLAHPRP